MFQDKQKNRYTFLILFFSSAFLFYFYGTVLMAPNDFLFAQYGDGFSQYFTFTSYVKNNQSYIDHTGSNYPYGEHIVYYDSQPFFGAVLRTLNALFPPLDNYTIGFLNILALFFLWWTPLLLYGILQRLGVRPLLAVWGAMGITFLEPQVFRLTGHFSLSYACAIPLTLYLLIRIYERQKVVFWTLLLGLSNLIWLYTHPYLGLMCCMITGSIFFFYWLRYLKKTFAKARFYGIAFIAFILPILIFQIVIKVTDTHTTKPENIYGVFEFCGKPDDVFFPNHPPFKTWVETNLNISLEQTWEGWSYIGLTTILTLIITFLAYCLQIVRRKKRLLSEPISPLVGIAFWASIPILLFSWAYPFIQFPHLLEEVKLIKQFRSLGRFSWVFYYVSTLVSIYFIHRALLFLEQKNQKILAGMLCFLAPLLYMIEGYPAHAEVAATISQAPNLFLEKYRPAILKEGFEKINVDDYQAILPLPFYYLGSGNYLRPPLGGTAQFSMLAGAHTGLPITAAAISRGDVWESRNLIQLVSPPYYHKKIKADFPSTKPILITRSNNWEPLTFYEQLLLDKAEWITNNAEGYGFYKLNFEDLFANQSNAMIDQFEQLKDSLHQREEWFLQDSNTFVFQENFERLSSKHAFRSTGAFSALKYGSGNITKVPLDSIHQNSPQTYHIKTWVYNGEVDAMNYLLIMAFGWNSNGVWEQLGLARPDQSTVIYGDWSLIEFSVEVPPQQFKELHINYYSNLRSDKTFYLDDLLIYNNHAPIYKVLKQEGNQTKELLYNGHILIRDDI